MPFKLDMTVVDTSGTRDRNLSRNDSMEFGSACECVDAAINIYSTLWRELCAGGVHGGLDDPRLLDVNARALRKGLEDMLTESQEISMDYGYPVSGLAGTISIRCSGGAGSGVLDNSVDMQDQRLLDGELKELDSIDRLLEDRSLPHPVQIWCVLYSWNGGSSVKAYETYSRAVRAIAAEIRSVSSSWTDSSEAGVAAMLARDGCIPVLEDGSMVASLVRCTVDKQALEDC